MTETDRFWETTTLKNMTDAQWESLCDGCGRCCLHKLADEETEEVYFTDIACRLLDTSLCRCKHYEQRFQHVSDCLSVRPLTDEKLSWLPSSCAYRVLAEGRTLAAWHPLLTGDANSVHKAGIGIASRCYAESEVPLVEWEEHIIEWID